MPPKKAIIQRKVKNLISKYSTANPFTIAQELGIHIVYLPLGQVWGFYKKIYRHKFIFLNNCLPADHKIIACAHELGHAILHPNTNTVWLREKTFLSPSSIEREANYFAVALLKHYHICDYVTLLKLLNTHETLEAVIK